MQRPHQTSVCRSALAATGVLAVLACTHVAGATASARLPAQVWGLSLAQSAPDGLLASARRAGVNVLILDSRAANAATRAALRRAAGRVSMRVYEPAYGASRATCLRAHRAGRACLLFAPGVDALRVLARIPGVDALVLHLRTPDSFTRLRIPPRVRVIGLVDLRDAGAPAWRAAIRTAAGSGRVDLAAAPSGVQWQAALGSYLELLAARGAPAQTHEPEPAAPPPPAPPTGLSVVVAPQSVVVSWVASPGIGAYEVSVDGETARSVTGTSTTFGNLACGRPYSFAVRAVAANGDRSAPATVSATPSPCGGGGGGGAAVLPPVIDLTAPATPAGLHAASIAATSVTLGWTAATDNVGVTGYGVQRDGTDAGTAAGPAFTVSGLAACTSYTFTVTARDAAGNASPPTAALTVRTAGCATAALFVAPGGSNANPCTDPALPCATFDGAFDRATAGDVVEVAGGTYAAQDISGDRGGLVTFRPATGATVTMHGTLSLAGVQHVKLVDFHFPRVDPNYDLLLRPCNGDVTLENSTGRRFFIFEGNSDITFSGGAWGGYSTPDDEDSGIGIENPTTLATCNGTTAPPAHNIVFDGVTFHDVFWIPTCTVDASGGRCVEWGASHPDCLEINGYVDGVTIRNSTFERCGNTMLSLYTDQGNVENVVVRNNTFRQMSPTSYYGLQWTDTTDGFYCSGDKFLDNSYLPNAPTAWQPNTPPRFECNVKPGGIPTEVAGNTFQTGPSTMDCDRSKTTDPGYTPPHVYDTNWRDNTFTDPATACSTP